MRKHGDQQVHTAGFGDRRGGATFQPADGGTICPEQSDRNSIPTGTGEGEDVPDYETVGGELGASGSMETGQKKTVAGCETVKEEEKQQSNKDVTVQCIDFCRVTTSDLHAVLRHAPTDLRGGPLQQHLVFWWQLWHIRKTHISVLSKTLSCPSRGFASHLLVARYHQPSQESDCCPPAFSEVMAKKAVRRALGRIVFRLDILCTLTHLPSVSQ